MVDRECQWGLEEKEGVEEQAIEARTYSQIDVEQPRCS